MLDLDKSGVILVPTLTVHNFLTMEQKKDFPGVVI